MPGFGPPAIPIPDVRLPDVMVFATGLVSPPLKPPMFIESLEFRSAAIATPQKAGPAETSPEDIREAI